VKFTPDRGMQVSNTKRSCQI